MKNLNVKVLLKVGITLSLLVYIYFRTDWHRISILFSNIRIVPFIVSFLILLLCSIPLALRLKTLLKPTVLQHSLLRLIQIYFISCFYSLFLPSGIGVAIARWYKVTENRVGRKVFFVITIIERMMLTTTLLLCVGIPLFLAHDESIRLFRSSLLPILVLVFLISVIFFMLLLVPRTYKIFSNIIHYFESRIRSRSIVRIIRIYDDLGLYLDKKHLIFRAYIFHLIFQILNFIRFYLVFIALNVNLPFVTILWMVGTVLLILSIPISFAGLGVREGGFAWLLALYGIGADKGVLLGVIISIQVFLNAGIGGILSMMEMSGFLKNASQEKRRLSS